MTGYNWFETLEQWNRALHWQMEKLNTLEQEVVTLREQIKALQSEPRNHIERIEYKFDQLKVENLNGTLTIGIHPRDDGGIDEMWLEGKYSENVKKYKTDSVKPSNADTEPEFVQEEVNKYIHENIISSLMEKANDRNVPLTSENVQTIVNDMVRQANSRIKYYMNHFLAGENVAGDDARTHAMSKVKQDLYEAMDNYLDYFLNKGTE